MAISFMYMTRTHLWLKYMKIKLTNFTCLLVISVTTECFQHILIPDFSKESNNNNELKTAPIVPKSCDTEQRVSC